jgi:hypothetical protein
MDLDVTSISAIVAAAGVIVGVILTIQELRHLRTQRQTDLVMRLWQQSCNEENVRAWSRLTSAEYRNLDDFVKKYGHPFSENPVPIAFSMTARFFEGIGIAVHRKIVDIDLVRDFWDVGMGWKKVKPIAEGLRKEFGISGIFEWFEYLFTETEKREQQLVKTR